MLILQILVYFSKIFSIFSIFLNINFKIILEYKYQKKIFNNYILIIFKIIIFYLAIKYKRY